MPAEDAVLQRPCYFLDKVYHAQLAGADAVLVANDHPGDLSTAVAPKDEGSKRWGGAAPHGRRGAGGSSSGGGGRAGRGGAHMQGTHNRPGACSAPPLLPNPRPGAHL